MDDGILAESSYMAIGSGRLLLVSLEVYIAKHAQSYGSADDKN